MAKAIRIKAPAADAPQSKDEVAYKIKELGEAQRQLERERLALNDEIQCAAARHQPAMEALERDIAELQAGIQAWCEAHRDELTRGGRVKTANLITGEVQWRQRPPSVRVRAQEMVVETLMKLGLERFLRTKVEINKEAILAEPEAVSGIAGLTVQTGVEDFVIIPFEQDAA